MTNVRRTDDVAGHPAVAEPAGGVVAGEVLAVGREVAAHRGGEGVVVARVRLRCRTTTVAIMTRRVRLLTIFGAATAICLMLLRRRCCKYNTSIGDCMEGKTKVGETFVRLLSISCTT
jgi:hypothetical protein